jgi:hypothetical protein
MINLKLMRIILNSLMYGEMAILILLLLYYIGLDLPGYDRTGENSFAFLVGFLFTIWFFWVEYGNTLKVKDEWNE